MIGEVCKSPVAMCDKGSHQLANNDSDDNAEKGEDPSVRLANQLTAEAARLRSSPSGLTQPRHGRVGTDQYVQMIPASM